jgi:hypothetical protein
LDAIRWASFDHELIESLELGSDIIVAMIVQNTSWHDRHFGCEHHYDEDKLTMAIRMAPFL